MKNVLVVAPHPDDETLGCGGTLLKHKELGDNLNWLIVTHIDEEFGFTKEKALERESEIEKVAQIYRFNSVHKLNWPTTRLDTVPMSDLVQSIGNVIKKVNPEIIYIPYPGDIHTDHKYVFDASISCTKWFRFQSIKRVLVYETLSETNFSINPDLKGFNPTTYVNITDYLDMKINIMKVFKSEIGSFPFPRSEKAIRSLAHLRGTEMGCFAGEAFMLLKEIID